MFDSKDVPQVDEYFLRVCDTCQQDEPKKRLYGGMVGNVLVRTPQTLQLVSIHTGLVELTKGAFSADAPSLDYLLAVTRTENAAQGELSGVALRYDATTGRTEGEPIEVAVTLHDTGLGDAFFTQLAQKRIFVKYQGED